MTVSIITTCFNSASTISDTFDSVLRQTYPDIEYIVKDGGSTDGTVDIIRQYEPKFKGHMKWISAPDRGIYDGMNRGIDIATGNVIGILNADDFFTDGYVIANMIKAMEEKHVDAVYGDIHFVNGGDIGKTVRYYSSKLFHPLWLRFGFAPAHPSFYLKREVYERAGLYKTDYQIAADFEMFVRLFLNYRISYYYLPQDFVTMRTGGSSTRSFHNRMIGLKEEVRACRENGIYTNRLFISMKYLYKIFGLK